MRRNERVTDKMVERSHQVVDDVLDMALYLRNCPPENIGKYQDAANRLAAFMEEVRAALSAALSIEQTQTVAWVYEFHDFGEVWVRHVILNRPDGGANPPTKHHGSPVRHVRPLYTHPPVSALVNAQADADVVESLDARMKAAGMYTVAEMMGVTPLTKWMSNPAINSIEAFSEWLDRKVSEYLRMKAAYALGDKDESDELYEWVQAHSAVFSTIRDQFQVVLSSLRPAEVGSATISKDVDHG